MTCPNVNFNILNCCSIHQRNRLQAHRATGFVAQVNANAQEVGGASGFTALTTDAIFRAGRGCDLAGFAAIPGHHLEHVEWAGAHTLGATDAGVVNLDGVGHGPEPGTNGVEPNVPTASGPTAKEPAARHPCSYAGGSPAG